MRSSAECPDGTADVPVRRRARHKRSTPYLPSWLTRPSEQEAIAHSRCRMILAVLSGQQTVKEVIEEQKICRALYYQLETRALRGMIRALNPMSSAAANDRQELKLAQARIRTLSEQLTALSQRKRSVERLLRLVLKSNRAPVNTARRGRRPKVSEAMMPGEDLP